MNPAMRLLLLHSGKKATKTMEDIEYFFVDGSYLSRVLEVFSRRFFGGLPLAVNPMQLFHRRRKGFFYDCIPAKARNQSTDEYEEVVRNKQEFFQSVRTCPGVHVVEGSIKGSGRKKRQKKIDVAIAVDMLTHAYRRNMTKATLLAGDLDFKPLVDALVHDGMFVTLWYEESSASKELVYAADDRREITIDTIYDFVTGEACNKFPKPRDDSRAVSRQEIEPLYTAKDCKYTFDLHLVEYSGQYAIAVTDPNKPEIRLNHYYHDLNYLKEFACHRYRFRTWEPQRLA